MLVWAKDLFCFRGEDQELVDELGPYDTFFLRVGV